MLETYPAILLGNRIEWSGEAPTDLPHNVGVRVHITLLERPSPAKPSDQGERMAAALERLAASRLLSHIADPNDWQREMRQDRPMPGKDA
jgi:hypothetical protein